ncbi:hypothetical protein OKN36_13070 [Furfurilactobacillus sp. OKN36]
MAIMDYLGDVLKHAMTIIGFSRIQFMNLRIDILSQNSYQINQNDSI